jgi:hypothetical protein
MSHCHKCARDNVERFIPEVSTQEKVKFYMGLNLMTKVGTQNLHYGHVEICLRAVCFQMVFSNNPTQY